MSEIVENWRRGLRGGELIHYVVNHQDTKTGAWGTISSWRCTHTGFHPQHLVSNGLASKPVMLSTVAVRIRDDWDSSQQCWFQQKNRFANGVFGQIVETVGTEFSAVNTYQYIGLPVATELLHNRRVDVQVCDQANTVAL